MRHNFAWTACLLIASVPESAVAVDNGLAVQITSETIQINQNGQLVLIYNKRSPPVPAGVDPVYHRSGFLHPVASPAGKVVTATFPRDHLHQHGIFSAWVKTVWNNRKVDFWNLAGRNGRVLHQNVTSVFSHELAAGFEVDLLHRALAEPQTDILQEHWKISVYPTDGSYHCFELQTTQTALTELPLMIEQHRYGGVALRGPSRWVPLQDARNPVGSHTEQEPSAFLNDAGSNRLEGNRQHARWVSLTAENQNESVSITVLCHANNFRAPQAARLHPSKPYFCYAPCIDGEFVIDTEHPYEARYRYLVTDARPDPEWLNEQWQAWCR
jgi:hypothetical protein